MADEGAYMQVIDLICKLTYNIGGLSGFGEVKIIWYLIGGIF